MSDMPDKTGQLRSADIKGSPALNPVDFKITVPVKVLCNVRAVPGTDCYHVSLITHIYGTSVLLPTEDFKTLATTYRQAFNILVKEIIRVRTGYMSDEITSIQVKEGYFEVTVIK